MTADWTFLLRGGPWHNDTITVEGQDMDDLDGVPPPVIFCWKCGLICQGHMSWYIDQVPVERALAYKREEYDDCEHIAVYVLGDMDPGKSSELREQEPVLIAGGVVWQNAWPNSANDDWWDWD